MKKPLIVFTYAPAGLGHIRVVDALISGIPIDYTYVEFTSPDRTTESTHRLTSLNVPARHIMEFFQRGAPEVLFTKLYTWYLKTHTDDIPKQFIHLIKKQKDRPEKIIIVATHFGLAYQLGTIKSRLEKDLNAQIFLVVQVTDDSPQVIWYVDSADLIVAPSYKTKDALQAFAVKARLKKVPIEVAPYPVDLNFSEVLPPDKITERMYQYDPSRKNPINMVIPVSGAAVGMEFFLHLMAHLHRMSPRFFFHVVCRKAPFTEFFLHKVGHRDYVRLYISSCYKTVVDMYERVYMENVISAEVTKPSEQAFKALMPADAVGGSFLLFAEPVGRQEYDNINFLKRRGFLSDSQNSRRGYTLPFGSKASADLVWDLFNSGKLLKAFNNFSPKPSNSETGSDGVSKFWEIVAANFERLQSGDQMCYTFSRSGAVSAFQRREIKHMPENELSQELPQRVTEAVNQECGQQPETNRTTWNGLFNDVTDKLERAIDASTQQHTDSRKGLEYKVGGSAVVEMGKAYIRGTSNATYSMTLAELRVLKSLAELGANVTGGRAPKVDTSENK